MAIVQDEEGKARCDLHLSRADCIDAGFIKLWEWDYDCNHYDLLAMLVHALRSNNSVKPEESTSVRLGEKEGAET